MRNDVIICVMHPDTNRVMLLWRITKCNVSSFVRCVCVFRLVEYFRKNYCTFIWGWGKLTESTFYRYCASIIPLWDAIRSGKHLADSHGASIRFSTTQYNNTRYTRWWHARLSRASAASRKGHVWSGVLYNTYLRVCWVFLITFTNRMYIRFGEFYYQVNFFSDTWIIIICYNN